MNCLNCGSQLEIFAREGREIYICPACLSVLLKEESAIKTLKQFCSQEVLNQLITKLLDDNLFSSENVFSSGGNVGCPKCGAYMQKYDFNGRLRFYVNKCIDCGSVWLNTMQAPLLAIAFMENSPEDIIFKKTVSNVYEVIARKKAKRIRSFDEIIAPFIVMTGLMWAMPLGDNILKKSKPVTTRSIIIACIIIGVLQMFYSSIMRLFALYPNKAATGEWYRLITYAFLHGGVFHIAGNMYFFNIIGATIEEELKWKKYLSLFCFGAITSGIFFMATTSNKDLPCVGASGAISAIIGAYLILFPRIRIRFNIINPLTFRKIITTEVSSMSYFFSWIVMNLLFGALQMSGKNVDVAYWGHIGGFIAGVVFAEIYKNFKLV